MKIKNPIKRITKGASVVEYGLLTGLIVALAIGSVAATGTEVSRVFGFGASQLEDAGLLDGSGVASNSGSGVPTSPPWEIPSEDLGEDPGGMVLTFVGSSVNINFNDPSGGSVIHWGDGSTTSTSSGDRAYSHTYGTPGEYDVIYAGTLSHFKPNTLNLKYVKSFGDVGISSLSYTFSEQDMLERVAPIPSTVSQLYAAFFDSAANIQGLKDWDTSNVRYMRSAFNRTTGSVDDISKWDVSNVNSTWWSSMFRDSTLKQDLSNWCVSQVNTEPENFGGSSLISKPVWGFCGAPDPSNGVHMTHETTMPNETVSFTITQNSGGYAGAATIHFGDGAVIPAYGIDFNVQHTFKDPGLHTIKIGNNLEGMTAGTKVVSVESFGSIGLKILDEAFLGANSLTYVAPIPNTVYNITGAFANSSADISGLEDWDTSNINMARSLFLNMTGSVDDISGWDVSNIGSTWWRNMFNGSTLEQDLSNWCVSHVTTEPENFGGNNLAAKPNWGAAC